MRESMRDYLQPALAKTGFCCSDVCWLSGSVLTCSFTFTPSMFRTLFCKGEAKKSHQVTAPKLQPFPSFLKEKKNLWNSLRCGPVTLWSDTYLNSLFLPSPGPGSGCLPPSILHASTSLWPLLMKLRSFPPED